MSRTTRFIPVACAFLLMSAATTAVQAREVQSTVQLGTAIRNMSRTTIPGDRARLAFIAEGAGKLTFDARTEPIYVNCDGIDVVDAKNTVVDGTAFCELKTQSAGTLFVRFQKVFDEKGVWHQTGTFTITGGTGEMSKLNGAFDVKVEVSPPTTGGKLVFGVAGTGRLNEK